MRSKKTKGFLSTEFFRQVRIWY